MTIHYTNIRSKAYVTGRLWFISYTDELKIVVGIETPTVAMMFPHPDGNDPEFYSHLSTQFECAEPTLNADIIMADRHLKEFDIRSIPYYTFNELVDHFN